MVDITSIDRLYGCNNSKQKEKIMIRYYIDRQLDYRIYGLVKGHWFNREDHSLVLDILFTLESEGRVVNLKGVADGTEQMCSSYLVQSFKVTLFKNELTDLLYRLRYKNNMFGRQGLIRHINSEVNNLSRDIQDHVNGDMKLSELCSLYPPMLHKYIYYLLDNQDSNSQQYVNLPVLSVLVNNLINSNIGADEEN